MGLIKCPDCNKEISDMAPSCPNCGRPLQIHQQTENASSSNMNVNNGAQQVYQQGMVPPQKSKKKGYGCLITFLIIMALFFVGFCAILYKGIEDMKNHPEKYDDSIAAKYIEVSTDEGKQIDEILNNCGISKVQNIEHDELLDNVYDDGSTGYRIKINSNLDNIIMYLNPDYTVYTIHYSDYELYSNNSVIATIQDYTFTSDEMSDLMIQCQSKVEEVLKSPSTAKFPNILEWGFKKEKNIVTVQGYVDSQNGFGAEIRSNFQFIIDTDTNTIQSFIFDGQELIQQ